MIDALIKTVLTATRKGLFRAKPVFKPHARVSPEDLLALESSLGLVIPADLRAWLLAVGYGDVDDELSFRKEWFVLLEQGQLKGGATFAQDVLGNYYAFEGLHGRIYYLARSEAVYAPVAASFSEFMEGLVSRDYRLFDWVDTLETQQYAW
jgi:hypothetical protein